MPKIVIAGGTGMIGRELAASLSTDGADLIILSREVGRKAVAPGVTAKVINWDPRDPSGQAALADVLADANAVVNLTGMPVGPLPWTAGRRKRILASRVDPTRYLVAALGTLDPSRRPAVFVCASGIDGYTDADVVAGTEDTDVSGAVGFLADVGRAWEGAAVGAEALGMRVVLVRTAFVLARRSALLPLLALPVRLFAGGRFGSGKQWFSWVHIDDLVAAYRYGIADASVRGPLIAAAPEPCRQSELVATLARVLRRPNWLPIPAWVLRLVLREEATLLLGSRRVVPARLLASGFSFRYGNLEAALREALGRPTADSGPE
ncbi:MAG: TIGR01777 family oxidoreductase [Chloroflexota bacterium]